MNYYKEISLRSIFLKTRFMVKTIFLNGRGSYVVIVTTVRSLRSNYLYVTGVVLCHSVPSKIR